MSGEKSPWGSSLNTVLQLTNKFCDFLPNRAAHTFPACQGLYVAGIILPPCVLVSTACIASLRDPHSASLLPPSTSLPLKAHIIESTVTWVESQECSEHLPVELEIQLLWDFGSGYIGKLGVSQLKVPNSSNQYQNPHLLIYEGSW